MPNTQPKKPRGKPFEAGNKVGKGRPRTGLSLAEFMRAKLEDNGGERLETLFDALYLKATTDGNTQAAAEILTRAYGKPIDTVKLTDDRKETPQSVIDMITRYSYANETTSTAPAVAES